MRSVVARGEITYDSEQGHVCTCSGEPEGVSYERTVRVDRSVSPTDSGSWWYVCSRCGAGGWSGC